MFEGRVFQSDGALNINAFLPIVLYTVGMEKKYWDEWRNWYVEEYGININISRIIAVYTFKDKL